MRQRDEELRERLKAELSAIRLQAEINRQDGPNLRGKRKRQVSAGAVGAAFAICNRLDVVLREDGEEGDGGVAEAREEWAEDALAAMRHKETQALIVRRLEASGANRVFTEAERAELARMIVTDLTTPRLRTSREHAPEKHRPNVATDEVLKGEKSA